MSEEPENTQRRVLIVEDNPIVRMNGIELLIEAGFEALDAESADAAIALLEKAREIDLLFTDIDMPGSMNGVELAELVHRRWPNVKLLITSGHHALLTVQIPESGRFVPKPYASLTIINEIGDLLDSALRRSQLARRGLR